MKLLAGLGNPGEKYACNRHNVGFMLVDYLASKMSESKTIEWKDDKKYHAYIYTYKEFLFIKPQTFMNRSGASVKKLRDFYKIASNDIIVAHDDLDIPIGKFKVQLVNGPKLHNGLESIDELLGTKEYYRIRIGVENRSGEYRIPGEAYVLQNFTEEEKKILEETFPEIYTRLTYDLKLI